MNRLDDILAHDLEVLLVAINPAPRSFEVGQHFATPTNAFWKLLAASKLTPRLYEPREATLLLDDKIGLTSLVSRATRAASELTLTERRAGARVLEKTVEQWSPKVVALLGLTLFPVIFPDQNEPGPGLKKITIGSSKIFVLPNPSGRNRAYPGFEPKLKWYRELARYLDDRKASRTSHRKRIS